MVLHDEQADILGGPILQRPQSGLFSTFSRYHFVFKSVALIGLALLVWIVCARGFEHLKKYRELRYRKTMRRKHGIPDSDCRPFAVAYAAAKRAHLEREAFNKKKTINYTSDHNLSPVDQRIDARKDTRGLRRRVPEITLQPHDNPLPGRYADNKRPDSLDFVARYNLNARRRVAIPEPFPAERFPICHATRKDFVINIDNNEESRKRSFEDESDVEHEILKKSRVDGDELIDGDEQPHWYNQYTDSPPRRVSRGSSSPQPTGDYIPTDGRDSSKRAADFHGDNHELADAAMDRIREDEVTELKAVVRGKKRDRAEAGSTFGGDDDDDIRNGRISYHRKRRTLLRRKIEVPARGQKRDREAESEGEGGGSETSRRLSQRSSKKKREKKVASDETSETSDEDPRISKDPFCNDRKVGDEWEADGLRYKVGDKGERLRLTLVKKARKKYHMPQDSQHPDRSAALEIYVETWMSDEQYRQAEGRQELAWQEAPRESNGSKISDTLDSPMTNGKSLLWDSVKGGPARRPFRQFVSANASSRINPFEHWQSQPILRRVASSSTTASSVLPGIADNPTRPGFRGFSKWEKQDREAEALARIRAKVEERNKAQVPPQKSSVTVAQPGTKQSVPTITLTPAPVVAAEADSNNSVQQSKPNTSASFFVSPPSTTDSIKNTAVITSSAPTGFSLPSTSTSASTSPTLNAIMPTAPTMTSPFMFTKPLHASSPNSRTTSPSTMPNPFGKGTATGTPSSSIPSSSTLDITQLKPPSMEGTSKPAPPTLVRDASSSPTVFVPPTKSQVPIFVATSDPPSILGSASAVTKAEAPAPVAAPTIASEGSKPTTPVFSFSNAPPATLPTASALLAPRFSFGQASTGSMFVPNSNLVSGAASQPNVMFKFSQTPVPDGNPASKIVAVDEPRRSDVPVSVSGTTVGSKEPVKPSLFGTMSGFGNLAPNLPSASSTSFFGKPATAEGGSSGSTPPKLTSTLASTPALSMPSSTPTGAPTFTNKPVFSFSGTNTGFKSAEELKPASLLGGATGVPNPIPIFRNSTETKPATFAFAASAEGSKSTSVFGGNTEGSKPTFAFGVPGGAPKSLSAFVGAVEGSRSASASNNAAENKSISGSGTGNSKLSNAIDVVEPIAPSMTTAFGPTSAASTFTFGKAADPPASSGMQPKAPSPFIFGALPGATGSMFGQTPASVTSGDGNQSVLPKSTSAISSVFGTIGTTNGNSGSSGMFTFGKPAGQNHKQEQ